MIIEYAITACLLMVGMMVTMTAGVRSLWGAVSFSLPAGSAVVSLVCLVFAATRIPMHPLGILFASTLTVTIVCRRHLRSRSFWIYASVAILLAGAGVAVLHGSGLVALTPDSYQYMSIGSVIAREGSLDAVPAPILQSRGLVFPMIHGLADVGDEFYLHSFSPLMALSGLGALVWFGMRGLAPRPLKFGGVAAIVGGTTLLLTSNRFVFNAFYINAHMIFAVWLLIFVGSLWLVLSDRADQRLLRLAILLAPALAILRPESSLIVLLALVPVISARPLEPRWQAAFLASVGLAMSTWHVVLLISFREFAPVPFEVGALIVIGIVVMALAAFLGAGLLVLPRWMPYLAVAGLLAALLAFALFDGKTFSTSWEATVDNLVFGEGLYGWSIMALGAVVALAYCFRRVANMSVLAFPVITALPFGLLMAHLRSVPYRVGPGDSLNRMVLHWMPLAVLSLIVMIQSRRSLGGSPVTGDIGQ